MDSGWSLGRSDHWLAAWPLGRIYIGHDEEDGGGSDAGSSNASTRNGIVGVVSPDKITIWNCWALSMRYKIESVDHSSSADYPADSTFPAEEFPGSSFSTTTLSDLWRTIQEHWFLESVFFSLAAQTELNCRGARAAASLRLGPRPSRSSDGGRILLMMMLTMTTTNVVIKMKGNS